MLLQELWHHVPRPTTVSYYAILSLNKEFNLKCDKIYQIFATFKLL